METENKPYSDTHGDGQGSHSQYSETTHLLQHGQQQHQPNTSQGYPVYPSNMAGMPPPYHGYGGGYGAPSSVPQQPQQVIVVRTTNPPAATVSNAESFSSGAICFSCFVFWCCSLPFGLAAFILASKYIYGGQILLTIVNWFNYN